MKNLNKNGISLIVLVITIIVMIILATAIIFSANGDNIIGKAKTAKSASNIASAKALVSVAISEWEIMSEEQQEKRGSFSEYAQSKLQEAGFAVEGNDGFVISEDGAVNTIYVDEDGKEAIIPEGFVVSKVSTEDSVSEGLVIYEGFEDVTNKNVPDARKNRNQFVWIPVDDMNDFVRKEGYQDNGALQEYINIETPGAEPLRKYGNTVLSITNDLTGEHAEYNEMKASVQKYGGFYIGRYEAGTSIERLANTDNGTTDVSICKDKYVYNFVGWGPSAINHIGNVIDREGYNQGNGAVELSRALYNNAAVKTHLIYGVQWDAALTYITTTSEENSNYHINSNGKGNYVAVDGDEGTISNTGFYAVNNIYDMAGNVYDWTMETASTGVNRIIRGGHFEHVGSERPASRRGNNGTNVSTEFCGFRVAMYLV